jgi:hypothetical protein
VDNRTLGHGGRQRHACWPSQHWDLRGAPCALSSLLQQHDLARWGNEQYDVRINRNLAQGGAKITASGVSGSRGIASTSSIFK